MTEFLTLFVLGLATGGFYALNALGLVVVFRSSGIINFAAGGVSMIGGYLEWQVADQWGLPSPVAVAGGVVLSALIGLAIYALAIRPLRAAATLTQVIATLAVLVSLQQAVVLVFGGIPKIPHAWLPSGSLRVSSVQVGLDSVVVLASTIVLTLALWVLYKRTRFGLATAALAEAPSSLAALGWDAARLRAANWAIGGALAGLAGAELGPILQLSPGNFAGLLIPTLAGAMIGGLRSFPLTLAGSLLVGAMQSEATRYLTWNGSGDAVPFLVIVLVLGVRGRTIPLRSYVQERLPRVGTGRVSPARLGVALTAVVGLSLVVSDDWVIGATISVMTATVLLSQVVITGYAGQLSLAQWTLGGFGAVVAANLASRAGLPFLLTLPVGMAAVIPVSLLIGLPSLRARGVSLAIATLGSAVAINSVVLNNPSFTGGLAGLVMPEPTVFGWDINSTLHPRRYFIVAVAVFVVLAVVVTNLRRGRVGRRMLAVRNNERAAAALGINVAATKLYAFVVAGAISAAAGVMLVTNQMLPQFAMFDPSSGLVVIVSGVLGGIGYVGGPLIGGLFNNSGLPNAIAYPWVGNVTWWNAVFPLLTGVVLVLQLVANPDGIADVISHGSPTGRRARRRARAAAAAATADPAPGPAPGPAPEPAPEGGERGVSSRPRAALGRVVSVLRRPAPQEAARRAYARELEAVDRSRPRRDGCALSVRNARVTFGAVVAIDGVDLDVQPGQVLAVIGPNGAGKTTLLDAITGYVSMSGSVLIDGRPIDAQPVHARARLGVARSFQSLELLEDMTVIDNLRCAAEPQDAASLLLDLVHPKRGTLTPATVAAIEAFGLADKLDKLPTEIAYGDRRLVAIARAVAGEPRVLLLDEPAAGLSEFERREVVRIIRLIAREWNIAVLLIEHDVDLVRRVADHVVALDFGRMIAGGDPDSVMGHPEVVRAYLGSEPEPLDAPPPAKLVGPALEAPLVEH